MQRTTAATFRLKLKAPASFAFKNKTEDYDWFSSYSQFKYYMRNIEVQDTTTRTKDEVDFTTLTKPNTRQPKL